MTALAARRTEIEANLTRGGYAVLVDSPERAMEVANAVAPEHLELMNADPESLLGLVRNAGAVFCGPWAPARPLSKHASCTPSISTILNRCAMCAGATRLPR